MTIKRVGPLSCAKIAAALYAVIGLVAGIFLSLAAMAGAFAGDDGPGGILGTMFGVGCDRDPADLLCLPRLRGHAHPGQHLQRAGRAVGGIEVDIQ